MPAPLRVAIIGGGIGGLATAALLADQGHSVTVIERFADSRPVGAGLLLQPPGAAVLDRLGVLDGIAAVGARVTRLDSRTADRRILLDLDYARLGAGTHGLGLARAPLHGALLGRALSAGAQLRLGDPANSVEEAADAAAVRFKLGNTLIADLAVIANGSHSTLVPHGLRRVHRLYPWGCLWTTVRLPAGWPADTLTQRCAGTRHMVGILPGGVDGDGHAIAAFYWSLRIDRIETWRQAPLADFHAEVRAVWPQAADLIAGHDRAEFAHATYRDVWTAPTHTGRVIVIGDAAHGTSPQLGQGATQALRDAAALADALAADGPLPDRLATAWATRRRQTAYYRLASRLLTPVFQSDGAWIGWARDRLAGPMGRIGIVDRQALLTLAGAKRNLWRSIDPRSAGRG